MPGGGSTLVAMVRKPGKKLPGSVTLDSRIRKGKEENVDDTRKLRRERGKWKHRGVI